MNKFFVTLAIVALASLTILPSPCESLDGKGNAIYTRMELVSIIESWCEGRPWIASMMKRFISCRDASVNDEMMKKGEDCAHQFLKDIDFSKMKGEEAEKSWVCSHKDKGEVLALHENIWKCAAFPAEQVKEMNGKLKECMEKKAREEEDEYIKNKKD